MLEGSGFSTSLPMLTIVFLIIPIQAFYSDQSLLINLK